MTAEWKYLAEYYAASGKLGELRAVYRTRPMESVPGAHEDFIFTKGGWKPTPNLRGIRTGYGEHEVFDVTDAQAQQLTDGIRRERTEAVRKGVEELVALLRMNGFAERAQELESTYRQIGTDPDAEARLHDLVSAGSSPFASRPEDVDGRIKFNRTREIVTQLTAPSQR